MRSHFLRRTPIGRDQEFLGRLRWVVRLQRNLEKMFAAHPFVHHQIGGERSRLTGLQGRLTDDHFTRSTPFQNSRHARHGQIQRAVADVLDGKRRAHRFIEHAMT